MIILRRKPEYAERPSDVFIGLSFVGVTKQARNGEVTTFDPESRSLGNGLESHKPTICSANKSVWIIGLIYWSSIRFQFPGEMSLQKILNWVCDNSPIEKFVKCFC